MEETKFKVGDRVKRINDRHAGMTVGDIGTVKRVIGNNVVVKEYQVHEGSGGWSHNAENLELVEIESGRASKALPVKFALQYELDSDPVEFFATLPEVKRRIKELAARSDLKRDSLMVYEIKSVQKVELGVSMSFKKV